MSYAILGYVMIAVIVVLLLKNKVNPMVGFIVIPPVFALLAGYSFSEINDFIKAGVSSAMGTSIMAMLSILFFSIMTENGLFDPIVDFLVKKAGNSVAAITIIASLVAHFSHMDSGTTSTLLVTVPAMLPIFKRVGIDRKYLLLEIVQAVAVVNLLPWGGGVLRSAAVTGMDPSAISSAIMPCMAVGVIFNLVTAYLYGKKAQAKIDRGIVDHGEDMEADGSLHVEENRETKVNAKYWVNVAWTLFILFLVFKGIFAGYINFMFGLAGALIINYRSVKEWNAVVDKYAKNSLRITLTMFFVGAFAGILTNSAMLTEMANVITGTIPAFLAPMYNFVCAPLSFIFSLVLGADGFHYGMMPLLIKAGQSYGFSQESLTYVLLMGADTVSLIRPVQATAWMAAGMVGVEMKDIFKKGLPVLTLLYICELVTAVIIGIVPIG